MEAVPPTKVSDVVAEFLEQKNIRHVFGIIGSGNAHIFDSIARRGFTEIVCVHHEQAAVMAAITYYRITGTVSAALLTTGAGSTNAVTGVVSAWMDSFPVMCIAGNENSKFAQPSNALRIWGIQGYDSVAMVDKVTKYSAHVLEPSDIAYELEKSYLAAATGRPGPTWLSIPINIQGALAGPQKPRPTAPTADDGAALDKSVAEILAAFAAAKRPVLWLGNGIRLANAVQLVEPLLEKMNAPALVSWAGIDMVDSSHPRVFGRAGVYGQRASNFILQNSDFVLCIGTRLAIPQIGYEMAELAREAKIAVVDVDPKESTKHGARIAYPVTADAKVFLEKLLVQVAKTPQDAREPWFAQCQKYWETFPLLGPEHADKDGYINSYPFMEKLNAAFKPDQIVVTDMGTALLSGHQVLKTKAGQRLMTSTGLGEMGFGLPAAIGASFARNKGEVLCLNCDGGMMMNLQELQTIAHHKLPIKIVIFNNDGYLMIKHTQKALFKGNYVGTNETSGVTCPNYEAIAKAFGFPYFAVRTWDDFDDVVPRMQEARGPVFCEVFMHPEQPLVPKLGLAPQKDGSIVSPPLEDLSPLLPRDKVREAMIIGMHPKSRAIQD